jgi:hypothetical protein
VKATAVEDEVEWAVEHRSGKKVQRREAAAQARPFILAWALSTASGETSTPRTSKPRSASQTAFVPVPAPISSVRPSATTPPDVTNSTSNGSGRPVSQGQFSRGVVFIPGWMRHNGASLAPIDPQGTFLIGQRHTMPRRSVVVEPVLLQCLSEPQIHRFDAGLRETARTLRAVHTTRDQTCALEHLQVLREPVATS